MLVIGRVMLGWGVGFANQAVPLYLSEIAPAHIRGTLNIMFQMATTIGELNALYCLLISGTPTLDAYTAASCRVSLRAAVTLLWALWSAAPTPSLPTCLSLEVQPNLAHLKSCCLVSTHTPPAQTQTPLFVGIWVAQWINYGTQHLHPHGWRLSVGLAIVPALMLFLGSLLLPDTPNSLADRGHPEKARRVGMYFIYVSSLCVLDRAAALAAGLTAFFAVQLLASSLAACRQICSVCFRSPSGHLAL